MTDTRNMTAPGAEFIEFALAHRVIELGDFKLKSGRVSPYFFNLGAIRDGGLLDRVGRFYADAIVASGIEFDVLFGPAYKGIPLASVTATCLHRDYRVDKAIAYNRKEVKDHGEGGRLVGAALAGRRVLILDDVITAGTAAREALALIEGAGGAAVGVIVCFDRGEKGSGDESAIAELEREYHLRVIRIADFNMLISRVEASQRKRLEDYAGVHGC